MRIHPRAGLACALVSGTLLTAAGCLGPHGGGHTDHTDAAASTRSASASASPSGSATGGPYVALGDSYTAGPGIPDQGGRPAGCDRSDRNYPALVAAQLGLGAADFTDVSCSGATVGDLASAQDTGDGTNPAQFSALSSRTRLVTLGIGGNDIGFTSLVTQCVKAGVITNALNRGVSGEAPCEDQHVSGGTDDVREKIDAAGRQLSTALADISRRAPNARVYVVGYPSILPSATSARTDCARVMGLAGGDVTFLRQEEQALNSTLRQKARAAGAGYVDTYTPSLGRDACSAADTRWIEPLLPLSPAASVHPNARGERGMADAVLHALGVPGGITVLPSE